MYKALFRRGVIRDERESRKVCDRNATKERERERIVGIVLVREECRMRPKLGRVGEREREMKRERDGERGEGILAWNVASL